MDGWSSSRAPEEELPLSPDIYTHRVYFFNLTIAANSTVNKIAFLQQKDNTDKLCNHLQLVCKNCAKLLKVVQLHSNFKTFSMKGWNLCSCSIALPISYLKSKTLQSNWGGLKDKPALFCEWLAYLYRSRWTFVPVSWGWAKPPCFRQVQGMSDSSSPRLPTHTMFEVGAQCYHVNLPQRCCIVSIYPFSENMKSLIRCSENNSVFTKTTAARHSAQPLKYCCLQLASKRISSMVITTQGKHWIQLNA